MSPISPIKPLAVIAGLDPAIQRQRMKPAFFARRLDCRVKPGNDKVGLALRDSDEPA